MSNEKTVEIVNISLQNSNITIQYDDEVLKIKKHFPESIPSVYVLTLKDLNTDYHKMVHSAVIKKLKPYYYSDPSITPYIPDFSLPVTRVYLLSYVKNF